MIQSTEYLSSAQAAARLGIKPETLYAYVSRGQIRSHRSSDGRTSLFDLADVARLERRRSAKRLAPADVTVPSDLTLVDKDEGSLWFRGQDAYDLAQQRPLEDIAAWLWTGSFEAPMPPWRSTARSLASARRAQMVLPDAAPPAERIPLIAAALGVGGAAPADLIACLVDALPGPASAAERYVDRLRWRLGGGSAPQPLRDVLAFSIGLLCEHGLTHPTLVARLTIAAGGGVAAAVASAMFTAAASVAPLADIESALAATRTDGALRAADALDNAAIEAASWKEPYRSADPRAAAILAMLADASPEHAEVAHRLGAELASRGAPPPTAGFALAAVAWSCGMPPGSAAALSLIARTVGWVAHAMEEQQRPTPYRPRLAYTGRPPRTAPARRTLAAVQDYLSRS